LRFQISFTPGADADLAHFRVVDQRVIVAAIQEFLTIDPGSASKRRKKLTDNPIAPWELRVGDHRVFYEIAAESSVTVLAIGVKEHNDLFIRGRKVEL
jgi:mRNA-degrading endonuclease RelE of RelBE toxin-antitoxin system